MFGLMSNASGLKQRFGYTIILVYSLRGIRTEKYFFVAGKQEQIGMWVFEHNLQELSDKKKSLLSYNKSIIKFEQVCPAKTILLQNIFLQREPFW
jgi:hypothetical protein